MKLLGRQRIGIVLNRGAVLLGGLALIAVVFFLLLRPQPHPTLLVKTVNDFSHVPLFGFVALVFLWISRMVGGQDLYFLPRHYVVALIGVALMGGITEWAQSLSPTRSGSLSDFGKDMVGGICALGLFATFDPALKSQGFWGAFGLQKSILRIAVGIVLCVTLWPVLSYSYAYLEREKQFPTLLGFSSAWELKFIRMLSGKFTLTAAPDGWTNLQGERVGRLEFFPEKYPGLHVVEPYPNWEGFSSLRFEVYSPLNEAQRLVLRIHDQHHNWDYGDRLNHSLILQPGHNHIHIPLDLVRDAPRGRQMDMSRIQGIALFAVKPREAFTLFLDNVRLE